MTEPLIDPVSGHEMPRAADLRAWVAQFDPDRRTMSVCPLPSGHVAIGFACRASDTGEVKRTGFVADAQKAADFAFMLLEAIGVDVDVDVEVTRIEDGVQHARLMQRASEVADAVESGATPDRDVLSDDVQRAICIECGDINKVDEDGCCIICGFDAMCYGAHAVSRALVDHESYRELRDERDRMAAQLSAIRTIVIAPPTASDESSKGTAGTDA